MFLARRGLERCYALVSFNIAHLKSFFGFDEERGIYLLLYSELLIEDKGGIFGNKWTYSIQI